MRYRLLGNSGVSEAALGTMTFGDDWGWVAAKGEDGTADGRVVQAVLAGDLRGSLPLG